MGEARACTQGWGEGQSRAEQRKATEEEEDYEGNDRRGNKRHARTAGLGLEAEAWWAGRWSGFEAPAPAQRSV